MKKIKSILCIFITLVMVLFFNINNNSFASSNQPFFKVEAANNNITLSGYSTEGGTATVISLNPYEYYGELNKYDNLQPVIVTEGTVLLNGNFQLNIDRFDSQGRDKVYKKYLIIKDNNIIFNDTYVTKLASKSNAPRFNPGTIKGLQAEILDDAFKLGVRQVAVNIPYAEYIYQTQPSNPSAYIEFETNGKTYYFNRTRVQNTDEYVKTATDNYMEVTFILIIQGTKMSSNNPYLIHPNYEGPQGDIAAQYLGMCAAPNLTNQIGLEYFTACMEFLAARYTREDGLYGNVYNVVVGNEIDTAGVWHNMGSISRSEFVKQYERALRLTDLAFKKYYSNIITLISSTHAFNSYNLKLPQYYENRLYRGRDILDEINALTKELGDFNWGVAHHPYPESLREPRFWITSNLICSDNFDTPMINFKNLQVLTEYLCQAHLMFEGKQRAVYLTEQGFNSFSSADSHMWPSDELGRYTEEKAQMLQAVAYAYSYYKTAMLDGISGYIYYRQVDLPYEGVPTYSFGLWTSKPNTWAHPGKEKVIYDVFKYIDTEKSLEYTQPLLYSGFIKDGNGNVLTSWSDIIEGFDIDKIAKSNSYKELPALVDINIKSDYVIDNFDQSELKWEKAEYCKSIEIINIINIAPRTAHSGNSSLRYTFEAGSSKNNGYAEKGIIKKFDTPLNLTDYNFLNFAVNVPSGAPAGSKMLVTVILYNQNQTYTSTAQITPDKWNEISVDLTEVDKQNEITKIKIWFNSDSVEPFNSFLLIDSVGLSLIKTPNPKSCKSNLSINILIPLALIGLYSILRRKSK